MWTINNTYFRSTIWVWRIPCCLETRQFVYGITWILIEHWAFASLWKFIKILPSIRTDWWSMHTKCEFILNIRYEKPDCNFQLLILLQRSNQKHVLYRIFPVIYGIESIMFLYIEWKKLKINKEEIKSHKISCHYHFYTGANIPKSSVSSNSLYWCNI